MRRGSAIRYSSGMYRASFRPCRVFATIAAVSLVLCLGACEVATSVRMYPGPSFSLRGSGRLASFRVYEPSPGRKIATPGDQKSLVWQIQATEGYFKGAPVERLDISYGKIPSGYRQIVPATTVLPLHNGKVYYFFAETTNAPGAEGFFYFDGNTATEIDVPDLCQSAFVGDVKPLKCSNQEPYVEPNDLELFVKDHRIRK
jgi:hypothetical protein